MNNIRIGIVTNPMDPATWEEATVHDTRAYLVERFASWPSTARIYDLEGFGDWKRAAALVDPSVLAARDVTPRDEAGVERLGTLQGPLLVCIPPADPITAIIAVVAVAVGVAAAFLLAPKLPSAGRNPSPNNSLSQRSNQERINQRIPDIFGTVESTPDLLMVPYTIFEANREVEVSYMGVGRGSYSILRVRDGDTALASISGASAAIYGPNTSPNSGDAPQLQIGAAIPDKVQTVVKLNEVNGQTLQPTNLNQVQGEDSIRFVYPDQIETNGSDIDFTEYFSAGDAISVLQADISGTTGSTTVTQDARYTFAGTIEFSSYDPRIVFPAGSYITISNAGYAGDDGTGGVLYTDVSGTYQVADVGPTSITLNDPAGVNGDWNRLGDYPNDRTDYRSGTFSTPSATSGINLNGNYTILSLDSNSITLNNPALVNESWNNLSSLPNQATDYVSPNISRSTESWVGPYIVDLDDATQLLANVVGANGLYTLSKKKSKQAALSVGIVLEVTPVNQNDAAIGPAQLFPATITGSNTERSSVGYSHWAAPSFSGRSSVRMRRTSPTPNDDDYAAVVDEVKWKDAYGLAPIAKTDFGNVTTVMTRTIGTAGALSVKNRRLNMRVTRRLAPRSGGAEVATDNAADIIYAMALDPYIGRRQASEIDADSIYDALSDVVEYFGSPLAGQFGYTFDDTDVSFEESMQTVAQAVFCRGYRQGRVIRLSFERATSESSLIFNARNISPGSQKRTLRFGPLDDHDGVEFDYTSPLDGAAQTYKIPEDKSATSPRSLEVVGVRSYELAYWQSWRAWNKVRYQNTALEMEAMQEASLVIPNDRVLIANRTKPGTIEGEVEGQAGTVLTVSGPVTLLDGVSYTIFIQHVDGTVEALGVTAGADAYSVVLSSAPRNDLSVDDANVARATYIIVPVTDTQTNAYLVTEREPQDNFTESVKAVNYSFLYYMNDELVMWIPVTQPVFYDESAFRRDAAAVGSLTVVSDTDRPAYAVSGDGNGSLSFPGFVMPVSYTKAVWLRPASFASNPIILNSNNANERFQFVGPMLYAGHNGNQVGAVWPTDGAWHHAAVSYDADTGVMTLHIDGVEVGRAVVDPRTPTALSGFGSYSGCAGDIRIWKRGLSGQEIREVYLAGLVVV